MDDLDLTVVRQGPSYLLQRRVRGRQQNHCNGWLQILQNEVDVWYVRLYERQLTCKTHDAPNAANPTHPLRPLG
jgi:hypothetical protein